MGLGEKEKRLCGAITFWRMGAGLLELGNFIAALLIIKLWIIKAFSRCGSALMKAIIIWHL